MRMKRLNVNIIIKNLLSILYVILQKHMLEMNPCDKILVTKINATLDDTNSTNYQLTIN